MNLRINVTLVVMYKRTARAETVTATDRLQRSDYVKLCDNYLFK